MSALALALALSISPAAAPDEAAVAPKTKHNALSKKTRRSRRRNHRSAAAQKSLASALALEEQKPAPAPRAPALPPASKTADIGSTSTPTLSVPKTGIPFSNLFWPCLVLIGATGLVFALRRKSSGVKSLRVVEQIAVGRGRDIVVVEVGNARMLLGATDGGISVLERSLPRVTRTGHAASTTPQAAAAPEGGLAAALASTLRRLKERVAPPSPSSTASFESHLDGEPCSEQEEIRLKLKARLTTAPISHRNEEAHIRERTSPRFDATALRTNTVRA